MLKPKPLLLLLYCFFIVFLIYNVKNNSTSTVESPNEIVEIPNEIVDENEIVQEKRNLNNPYFISYLSIFLLLLFVTLLIIVIQIQKQQKIRLEKKQQEIRVEKQHYENFKKDLNESFLTDISDSSSS